jgi:hypothetical protein
VSVWLRIELGAQWWQCWARMPGWPPPAAYLQLSSGPLSQTFHAGKVPLLPKAGSDVLCQCLVQVSPAGIRPHSDGGGGMPDSPSYSEAANESDVAIKQSVEEPS